MMVLKVIDSPFNGSEFFSKLILSLVHSSDYYSSCCSYRGFCCYVVNGVRNASGILHVSIRGKKRFYSMTTEEFNHIFLEPLGNLTLLYFFPFLFFVVFKPQNL